MREAPSDLLRNLVEIVERAQARRAAAPSRRTPRTAKRLRIVKRLGIVNPVLREGAA